MSGPARPGGERLEALQALRALAAALVVFVHASATYADKVGPHGLDLPFDLGGHGVKLFFCISGYIIYSASANLAAGFASLSFFARRRLIRIVPLYWAATLIYAIKLGLQGQGPDWREIACSLLFIPYTNGAGLMRPVLGAGWTLNFELFFYAALCLALLLPGARRVAAVAALFIGLLLARAAGLTTTDYPPHTLAWGLLIDPLLLYFLSGVLVGLLNPKLQALPGLPQRWRNGMAWVAGLLLAHLGLTLAGVLPNHGALAQALQLATCTAVLLLCVRPYPHLTAAPGQHERLRKLAVLAGDGSYSTYLVHGFVMGPAARVVVLLGGGISAGVFVAAMVVLCTVAGVLVFKGFESPLTRWLNQRWGHPMHEKDMPQEKIIFIAGPLTPMGGGMFRVAEYLLQSQSPQSVPAAQRATLMPLETRGSGSASASLMVLLGAMWRLLGARLSGRLAGVHINVAERMSLLRKCLLVVAARALGVPVLLHLHAAQLHLTFPKLPAPLRGLVRWAFGRATQVVVLGKAAQSFVVNELKVGPAQVRIVLNGVPPPSVPRAALSTSGANGGANGGDKARILFLGNLTERKGVSDLLQALTRSRQAQAGQVDAVFAGGGDVAAYQAKLAAMGLQGSARFVGWADQAQASQWMASADVLVLPSYDEGLPLVILEALANGVAVVCTPVGEIGSTLTDGEHALFVQPGDVAGLAAALDRVLSDTGLRERLEQQGHALYRAQFSLAHFADAVAEVHQQVFGVRSR